MDRHHNIPLYLSIVAALVVFAGMVTGVGTASGGRPSPIASSNAQGSGAVATTPATSSNSGQTVNQPAATTQATVVGSSTPASGRLCNAIANDRAGEQLTSLTYRRSVSFGVEICVSQSGQAWYHGARLAGDARNDSITLRANEVGAGIYAASNGGWQYEATNSRLLVTSPTGEVAVDQPMVELRQLPGANSQRTATLLVNVAHIRAEPDLSSRSIRRVSDIEGASMQVTGPNIDGWHRVDLDGTSGWLFGAFVFPTDFNMTIARTLDEKTAPLLDRGGRSIDVENASGSYVLVIEQSSGLWQVILPDGMTAYIDPSEFRVVR